MGSRTQKLLAPELVRGATHKRRRIISLLIMLLFLGGSGLAVFHFLRDSNGKFSLGGVRASDTSRAELYDDIETARKKGFIFSDAGGSSYAPHGQSGGDASGRANGKSGAELSSQNGSGADMSGSHMMVKSGEIMQENNGGDSSGGQDADGSGKQHGSRGSQGMALGPGGASGRSGAMGGGDNVQVSVTGSDAAQGKGGGYHTNAGGVLDALKRAANAAYQGANAGSYDTAHLWVSQTFDQKQFTDKALQYSGEAANLDKMDPNGIPNYLRKDEFSLSRADTLATPVVQGMDSGGDQGSTSDQSTSVAKYLASNSVMNTVFAGVGGLLGGQQASQNQGASQSSGSSGGNTIGSSGPQSGSSGNCMNSCTDGSCQMGCYE